MTDPRSSLPQRAFLSAVVLAVLGTACATAPVPSAGPPEPIPSPSPPVHAEPAPRPLRTWPPVPPHVLAPASQPVEPTSPPVQPTVGGVPASLMGTQWYALPTSRPVVALTFDAGANADAVPSILATLERYEVPGTFFLTGAWVRSYPEYAAQIGSRYPVANHTDTHPDLTTLPDAEVRSEVVDAAAAIEAATHRDPHPLFRFPFGASTDHLVDLVNGLGYGAINWTVDTRGWQGTSGGQSVDLIVDRVLEALRPGEIVIMHVGSHPTDHSTLDADALSRVIQEIQARGYDFVTVDQFL